MTTANDKAVVVVVSLLHHTLKCTVRTSRHARSGVSHSHTYMGERAAELPPFDPKGCRYDQSTYIGRLRRFRELTDPRTLLVGDEELAQAQALLDKHAQGQAGSATDAELWEAKRIKDAIIHPVTNEKMFLPGRMSAFVPVNTCLLYTSPSPRDKRQSRMPSSA